MLSNFFVFWSILYIVGLILVSKRSDKRILVNEISRLVYTSNIFAFIISLGAVCVFYFILVPISIPFSIKHIINQNKNK